jgi:hypothetical protein
VEEWEKTKKRNEWDQNLRRVSKEETRGVWTSRCPNVIVAVVVVLGIIATIPIFRFGLCKI